MVYWLKQNTDYTALTEQESEELKRLRAEVKRLEHVIDQQEAEEKISSHESNEEEFLDVPFTKNANQAQRVAVSSECYGSWNKEMEFVPHIVAKSH